MHLFQRYSRPGATWLASRWFADGSVLMTAMGLDGGLDVVLKTEPLIAMAGGTDLRHRSWNYWCLSALPSRE